MRDLRGALRGLRLRPASSALIVLVLGLGIGASTLVYSLARGALLDPIPYPDPEQLMMVWTELPATGTKVEAISGPEYVELREAKEVFTELSGGTGFSLSLTATDNEPERLQGFICARQLFALLGVEPQLGRVFTAEEDRAGAANTVILSHRVWQRSFRGDPTLIGRPISFDDQTFTVVGVMPPGFRFGRADFWLPLSASVSRLMGRDVPDLPRGNRILWTIARLAPGVSVGQANRWLEGFARRTEQQHATTVTDYKGWKVTVQPFREYYLGEVKGGVWALLGAVGCVLFIICANVAGLLLVRAQGRERDLAIQRALGADRARLTRQIVFEAALLGLLGAALGWFLALLGLPATSALIPDRFLPDEPRFALDGGVLAVTLALTLAVVLAIGLLPALQLGRRDLSSRLREAGRGLAGNRRQGRLRNALVVGEVALAVAVAIGFGLLARGFGALAERNPGFDPKGVLTFHVQLPRGRYPQGPKLLEFHRELHERLGRLPGVVASGSTQILPLEDFVVPTQRVVLEGESSAEPREAHYLPSSPGFFPALGLELASGRFFEERDAAGAELVAVVNQAFADRFFPDGRAVGRRLRLATTRPDEPWRTIVGVTENAAQRRLSQEIRPALYVPIAQLPAPGFWMRVAVRTSVAPSSLLPAIRQQVGELDAQLPIFEVRTVEEAIARDLGGWRLCVLLLGGFAALALVVAGLGLYGVIAQSVAARTHELGVRLALGAERGRVLGLVLRQGLQLAALGILLGSGLALALARWLGSLALGVRQSDPLVFVGVVLFLLAIALAASTLPAWRATRIDPLATLRAE